VMEDDTRKLGKDSDWNKDSKRLLSKMLNPKLSAKISQHASEIDWDRVSELAHAPRAVPVPITGGLDGVDAIVASSLLVENTLPIGSNWDGQSGLLVDEKTFNDLVGGQVKPPPITPGSPGGATPVGAPTPNGIPITQNQALAH
jgi:hypothetical protein